MKIAIGKNELEKLREKSKELFNVLKLNNDVIIIDEDNFSNDDIKREWINVIITSDSRIINNVFNSISVNTSTYIISPNGTLLQSPNNHHLVNLLDSKEVCETLKSIS